MGFEPTTPGLKDRDSLSGHVPPLPPSHGGDSFVSEYCHPRPVVTSFIPGLVAQHGDKMATSAESVSILQDPPFDCLSKLMQPFGAPSPPVVDQAPLPREMKQSAPASVRTRCLGLGRTRSGVNPPQIRMGFWHPTGHRRSSLTSSYVR